MTETLYSSYQDYIRAGHQPIDQPIVVYQGEPGAYSEMACRKFFGEEVHATGLVRFEDPFLALKRGEADYAVLPIENSTTGAIRQVQDLLKKYPSFYIGQTTVPVNHAFMALPGAAIEDIRTVYSHEQGLLQCEKFLKEHPEWTAEAQSDTAGSARIVAERQDKTKAAICSALAARIYGLNILIEKVNTNRDNTTTFLVIK